MFLSELDLLCKFLSGTLVKAGHKRGCVDAANFLVRALLAVPEVTMLKQALKVLASVYYMLGQYRHAGKAYERLKDVAYEDLDYILVMWAYKQMGLQYQKVKDYEKALVCFKTMMHLAWLHDNLEMEMQAYEHVALQYYYLGMIDKSS